MRGPPPVCADRPPGSAEGASRVCRPLCGAGTWSVEAALNAVLELAVPRRRRRNQSPPPCTIMVASASSASARLRSSSSGSWTTRVTSSSSRSSSNSPSLAAGSLTVIEASVAACTIGAGADVGGGGAGAGAGGRPGMHLGDAEIELVGRERADGGVGGHVADPQRADLHDVAGLQRALGRAGAVHEQPVPAAEVADEDVLALRPQTPRVGATKARRRDSDRTSDRDRRQAVRRAAAHVRASRRSRPALCSQGASILLVVRAQH